MVSSAVVSRAMVSSAMVSSYDYYGGARLLEHARREGGGRHELPHELIGRAEARLVTGGDRVRVRGRVRVRVRVRVSVRVRVRVRGGVRVRIRVRIRRAGARHLGGELAGERAVRWLAE